MFRPSCGHLQAIQNEYECKLNFNYINWCRVIDISTLHNIQRYVANKINIKIRWGKRSVKNPKRVISPMAQQPLVGQGLLSIEASRSHSHTPLGRTPLEEWSAQRKDLYLTTHNTHKRQTSMPPAEFEPTILVSERPQTHALDRAATGIGKGVIYQSE
jgi:hypothetical protein